MKSVFSEIDWIKMNEDFKKWSCATNSSGTCHGLGSQRFSGFVPGAILLPVKREIARNQQCPVTPAFVMHLMI